MQNSFRESMKFFLTTTIHSLELNMSRDSHTSPLLIVWGWKQNFQSFIFHYFGSIDYGHKNDTKFAIPQELPVFRACIKSEKNVNLKNVIEWTY